MLSLPGWLGVQLGQQPILPLRLSLVLHWSSFLRLSCPSRLLTCKWKWYPPSCLWRQGLLLGTIVSRMLLMSCGLRMPDFWYRNFASCDLMSCRHFLTGWPRYMLRLPCRLILYWIECIRVLGRNLLPRLRINVHCLPCRLLLPYNE